MFFDNWDGLTKKKIDRHRISLTEPWEVDYWTEKFGCTEEELREAVEATRSHDPEVVGAYVQVIKSARR